MQGISKALGWDEVVVEGVVKAIAEAGAALRCCLLGAAL